jgi:hypothetical protein
MVDIDLDGDEYVVKELSTDKENPALDPAVEL